MVDGAGQMVVIAGRMATYLTRYVQDVGGEVRRLIDHELRAGPRYLVDGDAAGARRLREAAALGPAADRHSAIVADRDSGAGALAPQLSEGAHSIFPDRKRVADIVYSARSQTGNFGIGRAGRAEADAAGLVWVGTDARRLRYHDTYRLVSSDGLRQYRPPRQKPSGREVEANFEWRLPFHRHWMGNAHLVIEERK